MDRTQTTSAAKVTYEQPRIEDYGTLVELTANKRGSTWDGYGKKSSGGGSYS